ncbi:MAG: thioesterase family protein [Candidatus Saccharibacteria bacterium]|nr:thioesterase family protein [Moraxellaceae bacterium]
MSIHQLLCQAYTEETVTIPTGWGQGRATYGGLVAGLLCSRLTAELGDGGRERMLRSATVSFIGAVALGEVVLKTEVFRSGKFVTQVEARLIQKGEVLAVLLASFGRGRESDIHVQSQHASPDYKQADNIPALPYIQGMMPEFFQQTDLRWAKGRTPFTGSEKPDFGGWMRWQDSFAEMTSAHLFALIDAWPPSVLPMFKEIAPASSLCWTVEFLAEPIGKNSDSWWQYQVMTDSTKSGYSHSEGTHLG